MHTGMTDDHLRAKLKDVDVLWVLARLLIFSPTIESGKCCRLGLSKKTAFQYTTSPGAYLQTVPLNVLVVVEQIGHSGSYITGAVCSITDATSCCQAASLMPHL